MEEAEDIEIYRQIYVWTVANPLLKWEPPYSPFLEERFMFSNDSMMDTVIKVHGPPPVDIQLQRHWYRDALRESHKVAAQTVFGRQRSRPMGGS